MRIFNTYFFTVLFTLCLFSIKGYGANSHSFQTTFFTQKNQAQCSLPKTKKVLITSTKTSNTNQTSLNEFQFNEEDSQSSSDIFTINSFAKVLVVIYFINFLFKGLKNNHFFYKKSISLSSCKFILFRSIRI